MTQSSIDLLLYEKEEKKIDKNFKKIIQKTLTFPTEMKPTTLY